MIWFFLRAFVGGALGLFALWCMDEGLWDDALFKGAMRPPAAPDQQFGFLVFCTLVPEIPLAGFLFALASRR